MPRHRVASMRERLPGIFVTGDARHGAVHPIVVAAGEGASAVQFVHRYFRGTPGLDARVEEPGQQGERGSAAVRFAR